MSATTVSCLIVDDEPMALSLVESYVSKTPFLELKGKCSSALEVLDYLNKEQVDLLFLDIQMPDLTGIELSQTLKDRKTRVIFTTAFDKYAIEGFKVDAIDYLLKPFDYPEFLMAANKAKDWFSLVQSNASTGSGNGKEFLFVRSEYKQVKINLNDVLYFEGLKDYIKIWLKDNPKPVLTLMSFKSLQQELPSSRFMRVHRSFMISLDKIDEIERSQVIIGKTRITVSDQYKDEFLKHISGNSLE
ncbi:MAG: LytTR family DNA-binding domain-containing protein [Flavobacteriales bacterium]|nr:LytTR family DNA-binding domain-containing protein [Flavobacteriales bacterium]